MPIFCAVLGIVTQGNSLPRARLWADTGRTVQISAKDLPPVLRKLVLSDKFDEDRALQLLTAFPLDWKTNAVVRYGIQMDKEGSFGTKALGILDSYAHSVSGYPYKNDHFRAWLYRDSMGLWLDRLQHPVDKYPGALGHFLKHEFYRPENLTNKWEAYLLLDICQEQGELSLTRDFYRECKSNFGNNTAFLTYGVRIFSTGGFPASSDTPPEALAPPKLNVAREFALAAWSSSPLEPGVMFRVATILALLRDPRAHAAAKTYLNLDDDADRVALFKHKYPAYNE